jgi:hypothetical protein
MTIGRVPPVRMSYSSKPGGCPQAHSSDVSTRRAGSGVAPAPAGTAAQVASTARRMPISQQVRRCVFIRRYN